MEFINYISSQCRKPEGITGNFMCVLMNIFNNEMYTSVTSVIKADSSSKILEIGYGNGKLTKMLYKKNKCSIFGIDISEDMKKVAISRNIQGIADGKIKLEIGDCCNIPYDDETFDYAVTMNTIYFWSDMIKGLSEIRRTLKKGGAFYNVVYSKKSLKELPYTQTNFKLYEKEEYLKAGKKAGFSKVGIKEVDDGDVYIIKYIK